jgi:hypothetical protein
LAVGPPYHRGAEVGNYQGELGVDGAEKGAGGGPVFGFLAVHTYLLSSVWANPNKTQH